MTQNSTEKTAGDRRKKMIRIFTFISLFAFLGQLGFTMAQTYRGAFRQSQIQQEQAEQAQDQASQLQSQAQGYESVLEREPENVTALEGLTQVRLQMNQPQEAVIPLERLVQLYPDREDYKTLLEQLKNQTQS